MNFARGSAASRVSALALMVMAMAGLAALVLVPAGQSRARLDASLSDLYYRLEGYSDTVAMREPIEAILREIEMMHPPDDLFVSGASTDLAAAFMLEHVGVLVRHHGGRVQSSQIIEPSVVEGLEPIAIRTRFSTTVPGLRHVLYRLEYGKPLLLVTALKVRAEDSRIKVIDEDPSVAVRLAVTIELVGFRPPATGP